MDIAPIDETDPVESVRIVEKELEKFSEELAGKVRWLVLNKTDLLLEEDADAVCKDIVERLNWQGEVHQVSAVERKGTEALMQKISWTLQANKAQALQEEN